MRDVVQQVAVFNQRLLARAQRKVQGFHRGVRQYGYYVFQLSQALVPVDTGELRASGWMRFGGSGASFTFTIGYSAPYAIFVHEDLTAYHPNGQAKWLEVAMRTSRGHGNTLVVSSLRAA